MTKRKKTLWHRLLGKLLELLLTPVNITVLTEAELTGRADIVLLRRQGATWTPEQMALLPDGIRRSSASHILLEFKYTESVSEMAFRQALSYDTFYRAAKLADDERLQTFLLSAKTPDEKTLRAFEYYPTNRAGVYDSRNILLKGLPVLALNELSDAPHNSFVKCFASRRRVVEAAFKQAVKSGPPLAKMSLNFWAYMLSLQKVLLEKGEAMTEVVTTAEDVTDIGELLLKAALSAMSAEERLRGLSTEEVLSRYKPEEVLSRYKPEEVLSRYKPEEVLSRYKPEEVLSRYKPEEVLSRYKPEEVLSRYKPELEKMQQQTRRDTTLKALLRTLSVRFQVSQFSFVERLESLDLETMEDLSEVALMVSSLSEFEAKLNELTA